MSRPTNWHGNVWSLSLLLLYVFIVPDAAVAQGDVENDPAQWVMPNANYAGWNYSPLDQIDVGNVQNLAMAWTIQLGIQD